MRSRRKKLLLAWVLGGSLIGAPAVVLVGARGGGWGLLPIVAGIASLILALGVSSQWHYGGGAASFRERLTALPLFTTAALLVASPFLAPVTVHDVAGRPAKALVVEVYRDREERPVAERYRLADPATEQDLGDLVHGLAEPVPVGSVIDVSLVPGGWASPISVRRLAEDAADVQRTLLRALLAVHWVSCLAVWVLWPRRED